MEKSPESHGEVDLERTSLLPGKGFFIPESIRLELNEKGLEEIIPSTKVVVVTDSDADGLTCAALVQEKHPGAVCVPTNPYEIESCIERVSSLISPDIIVYICDLCPDSIEEIEESLRSLYDKTENIFWCDHHRWDADIYEFIVSLGIQVELGDSEKVCAADVVFDFFEGDFSRKIKDLVEVTRDHDLWICKDDRSGYLADYANWAPNKEYIDTVREYGADLPEEVIEFVEKNREGKIDLIRRAIGRAEYIKMGKYVAGITYGKCSQNEVAEGMRGEGADVCIIIKPTGGVSIRGSDRFNRCHEMAQEFNGGGHPKAAGCMVIEFRDMLDYAQHWITRGNETKEAILSVLEKIVEEPI
jgi:oligoribonuclease NrnB/cAMP/cGMP phosphodiesterase (DHH superfamily)